MTAAQYEQFSNYAVASATGILALAFVAYVAQWGFARNIAPERELVSAGPGTEGSTAEEGTASERSDIAGGIGFSLTSLAWIVLLAGVIARGLSAERVPWGNMYEFGCAATVHVPWWMSPCSTASPVTTCRPT